MQWFLILAAVAAVFGFGWQAVCRWQEKARLNRLCEQIEHFLLYTQQPLADELGEGSLANLINQVARLEQQLLLQCQAAKRQEQQTTRFVENMAHQMKNALTALQIQLDMLAVQTGQELPALQKSQLCMARLTRETDAILRSSQLAEGKITMAFEPVDLNAELAACRERLLPIAASRKVCVVLAPAPPVTLPADPFWLGQALENVLKNAIEHTAEATRVTLTLRDEGAQVRILVEDEGPGIPPGELGVLFARFHRGETGKAGYGIGLSMAKDIVEQHHGQITARNRSGLGAVFEITLPVLEGARPYQN